MAAKAAVGAGDISSGEEGGVGKAAGQGSSPSDGSCGSSRTGLPLGVGELLGREDTERTGEQDLTAGAEEEEEALLPSESVKEVLIPSMEWKLRLKSRDPPVKRHVWKNSKIT